VTSPNNPQIWLIILHETRSLGRGESLINSAAELYCTISTLILEVSARTRASSTLKRNLSCNSCFKYLRDSGVMFITEFSVCLW
jgi:hypothetical protein